jgi:UDP-N-acetylmuramoylalanine--D-glutamate ligase
VGVKFFMTKNECLKFKAYIFGSKKNFFIKTLKDKLNYQCFDDLKSALKKILLDIKIENRLEHTTILFSPSAASFDAYKNFEDRGNKFNFLINKLAFKKLIND